MTTLPKSQSLFAQKIRDRIQWTLADAANTETGIILTLEAANIPITRSSFAYNINVLMRKGLVKRVWSDRAGKYIYSLVPTGKSR